MSDRVQKAITIRGWMDTLELQYLERIATGCQLVIELGSFCGRSSQVLAAAEQLVCVDLWGKTTWELEDFASNNFAENVDIWSEWEKNKTPNMVARRGDLYAPHFVYPLIADYHGRADVVFIDANHGMQSVCSDILLAGHLVKPGGIICGHDYCAAFPSVIKAVEKECPTFEMIDGTTIWSVQT